MATSAPPAEPRQQTAAKRVAYEDFVDKRIQQTRGAVKLADLATGVVTLLAWTLFVLLLSAVADHWLVAGGFTRAGRFALFAIGAIGGLLYLATRLAPRLLGSVNPLYAAQEIEKESPQLKNSVLNLLQLREHPASAAAVRQTLERQAAERLAAAGEAPIDRTPLLRAAKFVLALVAAIGVYVVASPKDFFASAGRVLAPWADIAAPSRVRFDEVTPGDQELAQGERLEIGSMVSGLRDDEIVEVVFTTSDGRAVERRTTMRASESGVHHTAALPPGGGATAALGLQGDLQYRLEAGDARTRNYRVGVTAAPTIAPARVRYEYPKYTGYAARDVEGIGDLRAIEGTRVTLMAVANLPIESAQIDLGADGRPDVRMRTKGRQATGALTLRRDPNEPGDTATNYVLRFSATDGQANHDPPQYRVEVIADLAPEVEVNSPEGARVRVRVDERVFIQATARDPDFALSRLRLVGEAKGRRVLEEDLLRNQGQGKVEGESSIIPEKLGLQPGETLDYWVEAVDNRTPEPNKTVSTRRQLLVIGPEKGQPQENPQENGGEAGQGSPDSGAPQDNPNQQNGQPSGQGGAQRPQENTPGGGDPTDQNQPGQNPNESPQEQEKEQDGEGREASPGGLRAPGEGGESGDEQAESSSQSDSGGSDSEASDEQQSGGGAGQPSGQNPEQSGDPHQANDQPGEQEQAGGGDQSDTGQEGAGEPDSPTARDGSDDGSAFEKIREFLKDQQGGESGEPGDDPGQQDASQNDDGEGSETGQDQPSNNDQQGGADGSDRSENGSNDSPSEGPADESPAGQPSNGSPEETGSQDASRDAPGEGERPAQPDRPEQGPGPGEQDQRGDSSDSTSSESGGEAPPGQESDPRASPREGTGDSGQNQAADQGAGQSADQGAGESTGESGGQEESDGGGEGRPDDSRTGQGQEQPGESGGEKNGGREQPSDSPDGQGNRERPLGDGAQESSGDKQGDSEGAQGEPADAPDTPVDRRGEGPDSPAGDNTGDPVGIGDRGPDTSGTGAGTEPGGDAANLEYARKQTELVLNQLEDQLRKKRVDPELLDRLGWTEQDLRRFVERWQTRRREADRRGADGQAELDRALRSLGVRPDGATATRKITAERLRELRQRARQKTPPRLREQLELFNRSLNAAPAEE